MFQENNLDLFTTIAYHVWWPQPSDPFYQYNTADASARVDYYAVNGVPFFAVDGYSGSLSSIDPASDVYAPLGIEFGGDFDYSTGEGICTVTLSPETGVNGTYKLHLVLVQNGLHFNGNNGYPNHQNVMRDMFPSPTGTDIVLQEGVELIENIPFSIPSNFVQDNCRLVAFVQATNHDIVNAAQITLQEAWPIPRLTAINEMVSVIGDDGDGTLNPGESAEYAVTISNDCNFLNAFDVTGYLTSSSPYITITDGESVYDMIVSCDFVTNFNDKFAFTVSEDAPEITDFEFNLRLVANQSTEAPYETNIPLTVSMDLFQLNYPVNISQPVLNGNAVVDLDGDGVNEIVITGSDSLIHVFTLEGNELLGFPYATGNQIFGSPAIGDIDNDGDLEIVVASRDRKVYVIQHDGTGLPIFTASSYLWSTPALSDLDGDGDMEIVIPGYGYELIVLHHDGSAFQNFPLTITDERMSCGASIADLDGDGSKDIIFGTWGDKVHAYDLNGQALNGFPVDLDRNVAAPPVVTDIDGDGTFEILVGQDGGILNAISNSGTILWTKVVLPASSIRTAVAVWDFEGDGNMETIYTTLGGDILLLDYQGNTLPGWPQSLGGSCYSSPVTADLDGDGVSEIIVGSNASQLFAFHMDGSLMDPFPLSMAAPVRGTPTVFDLSQDGTLEIVVGTDQDLSVVNLKFPVQDVPNWSTARGNMHRTGFYNPHTLSVDYNILPQHVSLKQNFPNPFNPSTTIEFGIPTQGFVSLTIYDVLGQEIVKLVHSELSPGTYTYQWGGKDAASNPVETGIYFARISSAGSEQIVKMMLLK